MAKSQQIKIINILLASIDGKIATHDAESSEERRHFHFTNDDDFFHMQKLTASCDAVFIGAKSMHSEIGAFRVAHLRKSGTEPHWYVFTKTGKVNLEHPFWHQQNIPKSVFHLKDLFSLKSLLHSLKKQKVKRIALLGGGELNGFFWKNHLVSELHLTLSPFIIGAQNAPSLIKTESILHSSLELVKLKRKNNFLFLSYKALNEKNIEALQNHPCSNKH